MANETEEAGLSFGIQDTMEMGQGNSELLNDLLAPETATGNADDLKDINEEEKPKNISKPKTKVKEAAADDAEEEEEEKENGLDTFLNQGEDDDDDEEEEPLVKKPKAKIPTKNPFVKTEDEEADDDEDNEEGGTQFEALSNDLFNLGIFSKNEDEEEAPIKTPEQFLERFKAEKQKGAIEMVDEFLGQFGQDYQDAFDAIYVKGINPREYFTTTEYIEDFSNLDLTKEQNQEKVVRQALTDQGFDTEDVDSEIERLKNYGDLETVSQKHHKVLIKKETAALAEKTERAALAQKQKLQMKQAYITNVNNILQEKIKDKVFDGIPLNPKIVNELQDFLLVDKWKTDSGETLTDFDRYILELKRPENHTKKVKVGLLLKLLEQDPTLSTIQKSGVSKKTEELFKEVSRQVSKSPSGGKTNAGSSAKSWFKQ